MVGVGLLLSTVLAGCSTPPAPTSTPEPDAKAAVMTLVWPTLDLTTTPTEVEVRGYIYVAWSGPLFAVAAEREADLPKQAIGAGDTEYTTNFGMGWTQWNVTRDVGAGLLSPRVAVWDVKTIAADSGVGFVATRAGSVLNATGDGTWRAAGRSYTVHLEVGAQGGRVVWARLTAPEARESPFTLRETQATFPFTIALPTHALPFAQAAAGKQAAIAGHDMINALISNYTAHHAGQLPQRLTPDPTDPQSLGVELVASGKPWPDNAFGDGPMRDAMASGHFSWTLCGSNVGRYDGWGWDGEVKYVPYNGDCPGAARAAQNQTGSIL
jgi:hypothetical protein